MSEKPKIELEDAFSSKTPQDNIRLYEDWAETYESDFVAAKGYVYHERVVEQMRDHMASIHGAILDVGCGTGIVGIALQQAGFDTIDGVDISPAMLAESRKKTTPDGQPVYRKLIEADLTSQVDLPDGSYAGIISSGTFTHGHLGPETMDQLWRLAEPGARCVVGINSRHYDLMGFGEKIAIDASSGVISTPELIEVAIYDSDDDQSAHSSDTALIVDCTVF